ncbi:hypothetical protein B0H11DRAFT_2426980 [Mycena galericulata]|nr:hypothetical protein B0H11DRAFT_2426980 [Mycena galericulata]
MSCFGGAKFEYPVLCEILLLLNVCTLWTDIALSTTRIWATLCIDIPRDVTVEFRDIFSRWLSRSRGYPLSLSLGSDTIPDPGILHIVATHAHYLQELELPSLSYLHLFRVGTSFPALLCLHVGTDLAGEQLAGSFDLKDFIQVLQSAPALVHCSLSYTPEQRSEPPDDARHGCLKNLSFASGYGDASSMLNALTFPMLEELRIPVQHVHFHQLTTFLIRSSPPLDSITLHAGKFLPWEGTLCSVEKCLHLVPSVTRLELTGNVVLQNIFLAILSHAPCDTFLPNLHTLILWTGGVRVESPTLRGTLSSELFCRGAATYFGSFASNSRRTAGSGELTNQMRMP